MDEAEVEPAVLGEYVNHHVEEETEMFPESRHSDVDLKALGLKLATRKQELMASWRRTRIWASRGGERPVSGSSRVPR